MARDLSTLETTQARTDALRSHVCPYPAGHPLLPEGGRVSEFHFPETQTEPAEKVVFIERNGNTTLRRTSQMWF
jgi:hypothetical protein